jgi:predicted outer membrane repeat protein
MPRRAPLFALALAVLCACHGHSGPTESGSSCDADGDGFASVECGGDDCDDADPAIFGGATETCNGADDDCNGEIDDGAGTMWYADADGDGFGGEGEKVSACEQPKNYAGLGGDCDDTRPEVHPDAGELCDGLDDDCDGAVDEDLGSAWYPDADADGYGDADVKPSATCTPTVPWVEDHTDCDDSRTDVHPGAAELPCDGLDNDCDGAGTEGVAALDGVEYLDLQRALDAATDGGTVYVCPGTHDVDVRIADDRTLTLASFSGDAADTILTGAGAHRLLAVSGGGSVTVSGLTFDHGRAETAFTGTWVAGGAISVLESDFRVEGCTFLGNASSDDGGGGALIFYSVAAETRVLAISDCDFERNEGGERALGGAVAAWGTAVVTDSRFLQNHAGGGGALYLSSPSGTDDAVAEVSGCTFDDDEALDGGAIFASNLVVEGSTFIGNIAREHGGAIFSCPETAWSYPEPSPGVSLVVRSSTFDANASRPGGGGAIAMGFSPTNEDSLEIQDSTFTNQHASKGGGGAILLVDSAFDLEIAGSRFEANSSEGLGGAILVEQTMSLSAAISDTDFLDDTASAGGAVYVSASGPVSMTFFGGEISGNTALSGGGFSLWGSETGSVPVDFSFDRTLLAKNVSNDCAVLVGAATVTSSDSDWGTGKTDNDPCDLVWFDAATGAYTSYCDLGASETFACDVDGVCA